jgi:glycosyltransferase involved in cell wall biosynthesis/peroxiredoxin
MKHKTTEQQARATIFVQIASYRDTECQWTVKDLFEKAAHPERVFVGICQQNDAELDKDCFVEPYPFPDQVREVHYAAKDSKGVCWARHEAQKLYKGEDYVLMIDSHMRFVEGWDQKMLHELSLCESEKAILTAYPPGYTPPNNLTENAQPAVSRVKQNNPGEDIRGEGISLPNPPDKPIRGAFWSAGYLFAPGELVKQVPYDPYMYFNQEEISLAVRAYTCGWDIYHPVRVFIYHNYIRLDEKERPLHWEDHSDWLEWQQRAMDRLFHLVGHKKTTDPHVLKDFDKYGLGFQRTLDEFCEFSGMDFANWRPTQRARSAAFIPDLASYQYAPQAASQAQPAAEERAADSLLAPLSSGHYLPRFTMQNEVNKPFAIENMAGKALLLVMIPYAAKAQAGRIAEKLQHFSQQWDFKITQPVIITEQAPASYIPLMQKYELLLPLLHDVGGALGAAFDAKSRFPESAYMVLADANLKIHAVESIEMMDAVFARGHDLIANSSPIPAPVSMVPLALTGGLAKHLSATARAESSGYHHVDDVIVETMLDDYFSKSILPEIRKSFGFEVTHRETYQLLQLPPSRPEAKANLYRDTSSAGARHRKMTALIPLPNAQQACLHVSFPEYAGQSHKVPSCYGMLFSSAQLYSIHYEGEAPLTVLQAFFYDEEGESKRVEYLRSQGVEEVTDDNRLFNGRIFPGL